MVVLELTLLLVELAAPAEREVPELLLPSVV
jgi:hypothetical protein